MICDKVQEMSFCVGSAVLRIFDAQNCSGLKRIDFLTEARNLLDTEIKRLTKGESKTWDASFVKGAAAAPKERKKRRTKEEMDAARNGGKQVEETVVAVQTEIETDNKPAAKPKKKEKAPTPKAAPVLPAKDLDVEDEEEFDEEYEAQEEKYPVGHFDEEEDEISGINV